MFDQVRIGWRRIDFPFGVIVLLLIMHGVIAAQGRRQLYGTHGISPQAVRQGTLGSCYFHATLASIAKAVPEALRNAIRQESAGSYRVRFFDGSEEIVYPQDVEFGRLHSYDRSEGMWVAVLMRGYAQYILRISLVSSIQQSPMLPTIAKPLVLTWLNHSGPLLLAYDRAVRSAVGDDGVLDKSRFEEKLTEQLRELHIPRAEAKKFSDLLNEQGFFDSLASTVRQNGEVFGAYAGMGQGGIPENVMRAFLGSGETQHMDASSSVLEQLRELHDGQAVMVAGTSSSSPGLALTKTNWWVPSHAFSVLDYEESSGKVMLRNPWGTHPDSDGCFWLPLQDFLRAYKFYSISHLSAP